MTYSQCSPFATCLNGSSGQAVDFTVTDLNGNSHNLYSYLNSNKIVVLEYLSVTCGHCINHAPYIEDFHEAWGPSGNDLVELIGLEINVTTNGTVSSGSTVVTGISTVGLREGDGVKEKTDAIYESTIIANLGVCQINLNQPSAVPSGSSTTSLDFGVILEGTPALR